MGLMRFFLALGLAAALAGCQESGIDLSARTGRVVVGPNVPVALESMDGAPQSVAPRFSAALAREAQVREISFVDSAKAPRFRLRGYISAYPESGGTTVAWVWDVFDQRQKRAQRVSGSETVRRTDSDPWNAIDDAVLKRVASRSLDEIAAFLASSANADVPVASAKDGLPPPKDAQGSSSSE